LALLKIRQNKYEQAFELLSELKKQQPASFPVAASMVELNTRQKKETEAIKLCDEMVKQFGNASAYLLRAKVHTAFADSNNAERDFDQAATLEPDNAEVWVAKSNFELSRGRASQACEAICKAVSLMPENIRIQEHAVGILLSSNEPDKVRQGMELLDKALSQSSKYRAQIIQSPRSYCTNGFAIDKTG